ncbi:MAG: hypothetical protein WED09_01755 [Homoserinimonas sp.]
MSSSQPACRLGGSVSRLPELARVDARVPWRATALNRALAQTPEQGARAQIRAALDPDMAGGTYIGTYIGPTRGGELRGPIGVAPSARDLTHRERLWALSEELTDVYYQISSA